MTEEQKEKCHYIIHSFSAGAGVGNVVPIPGLGLAADTVAMVGMTLALCNVFGGSISESLAKTMAITALKNTMLKQPVKTLTKELSKLFPFVGQLVAPTISVGLMESAGWLLADELEQKFSQK